MKIIDKNGNAPTEVDGAKWNDVFKSQPRYFYDPTTNTLGLDGEWKHHSSIVKEINVGDGIILIRQISENNEILIPNSQDGKLRIYLGDSFITDCGTIGFWQHSKYQIVLSPNNKEYYIDNDIFICRSSKKPMLPEIGGGFYLIRKNDRHGVVDANLKQIIPCEYEQQIKYDEENKYFYTWDCYGKRIRIESVKL